MLKCVSVITNRNKDIDMLITEEVIGYLNDAGVESFVTRESVIDEKGKRYTDISDLPDNTSAVIVLGGDGTMIQAARDLFGRSIPMLGINLGTVGFLSEIEVHGMKQAIMQMIAGDYDIENRMTISADIATNADIISDNAINDVVITRSGFSRLIHMDVYVNNDEIYQFHGDGIIISTPTGSTGYNLSAGGPVVIPGAQLTVITPICPHALFSRSIVVSGSDKINIRIGRGSKTLDEEAIVTVDGSSAYAVHEGDSITITKSDIEVPMIRLRKQSFFDVLRNKLGDKGG